MMEKGRSSEKGGLELGSVRTFWFCRVSRIPGSTYFVWNFSPYINS